MVEIPTVNTPKVGGLKVKVLGVFTLVICGVKSKSTWSIDCCGFERAKE
jgi:hypothetical protein